PPPPPPHQTCGPHPQGHLFAPAYDARVPVAILPDVHLFKFEIGVAYCTGNNVALVRSANVLGLVDTGTVQAILEQLGFTFEYHPELESARWAQNRAEISGDFGVAFNFLDV